LPPTLITPSSLATAIASNKEKSISSNDAPASALRLDYKKPDWSSRPPLCTGKEELDEEGNPKHYYLEVIKSGSIVDKINLEKEFITFGRLDSCDVMCEHPSLSRYHAILQYSDGQTDIKYPQGFYIYDFNSTHGTCLNKIKIEPNKYIAFQPGNMIKFGLSTRIYLLHGPKSQNNSEDLRIDLTHEQMKKLKEKYSQIALKLKVRRELEEEKQREEKDNENSSIDWGMGDDNQLSNEKSDDEDNQEDESDQGLLKGNKQKAIEENDESFYASDPKKALKNFFDREGDELFYDVEELAPGKYKCKIRLPLENNYGEPIYVETQHNGKKKECVALCALEACRILNSEGILQQSRKESEKRKKEKDWESADFYDSDEDTYLDRTGDIERKRLNRMALAGKLDEKSAKSLGGVIKNKVHTFDSILSDMQQAFVEKNEIENKLEKCKQVFKAVEEDDLDAYISSLKTGVNIDTVTRAKLKKRLAELNAELNRLEKLLSVAKPSSFDAAKWKQDLQNKLKPIETAQQNITEAKSILEIKKSPNLPSVTTNMEKSNEKVLKSTTSEQVKEKTNEPIKVDKSNSIEKKENPVILSEISKVKRQKVAQDEKPKQESSYDSYDSLKDDKYAVWLPPVDQSGDGKTKLNEKFGY
jgi:pSer/pThr/pTyr-binding forkhead associated (FHA) protein/predicted transcriptional regulator